MKLPRDLASSELEKALRRAFGYNFSRQSGSHRRPAHDPLKPGTLRAILGEVAAHHRLPLEQVLQRLEI
jgi:predicted RNA binding protein YcfA (HicA-like mRNA interferase family)